MKVKRIIEIEEYHIKELQEYCKGEHYGQLRFEIISSAFSSIAHSIPYDDSGDLISREALIREIGRTDEWYKGHSICNIIDNAPTVNLWQMRQEATENALKKAEVLYGRTQGEWIKEPNGKTTDIYRCSICGRSILLCKNADLSKYPFCHCGADMRPKGGKE